MPDASDPAYRCYQLTVLIIDFDGLGPAGVVRTLEETRYPNYCIAPSVLSGMEIDIGTWSDDHPLNQGTKRDSANYLLTRRHVPIDME